MIDRVVDKYSEVLNGIPVINYKKAIKMINLMNKTGFQQNRTQHNTLEKSPVDRFKNSRTGDTAS